MTLQLQVTYKIREFGDLIGKSYWQTRRILVRLNIPIHSVSKTKKRKWFVYLSDIQANAPDLFQSLFLMKQVEGVELTLPPPKKKVKKTELPIAPEPPPEPPQFQRKFSKKAAL